MSNPIIIIITIFTSCGRRSLPFRTLLKFVLSYGFSIGGSDSLYKSAQILILFN